MPKKALLMVHAIWLLISMTSPFAVAYEQNAQHVDRNLLNQYLQFRKHCHSTEQREAFDTYLRKRFETKYGVLITDTAGMTATTEKEGVFEMLARIQRMLDISEPLIRSEHAVLVKSFADDMMIIHPNVSALYRLAQKLIEANCEQGIKIAAGISYGSIVDFGGDIFGHAVNIASKLGEDIAKPGEILVSADAFSRLLHNVGLSECELKQGARGLSYFLCHAHNV